MKKDNLVGEKFNKLLILEEVSKDRNGHVRYLCQCDCGNTTSVLALHLKRGTTKSCGCAIAFGKDHKQWSGFGEISGRVFSELVYHGKKSKGRAEIEFSLTIEYLWDLFLSQNRKCRFSGIELKFPIRWNDRSGTASLDRIDSNKGYVEGNVQWVHKDINRMKNVYTDEYFINMCKLITKNIDDMSQEQINNL